MRYVFNSQYGEDGWIKKDFEVEIKEILSRVEVVKAETEGEVIDIAMGLYYDSKIILDADDYKGVDFKSLKENENETRKY